MKKTVTLLAVSLLAACQSAPDMEHPSQAVFELERESAHLLAEQTKQLQQRMAHYCQAPTTDISALKQEWQASMQGWMALQGQQRGPSAALDLSWNMQFWPDKKDTTGHKMKQLLAKPPVWEVDDIAKQSVAVQGLGALEWLIFDSASPLLTAPQQACPAAMAIVRLCSVMPLTLLRLGKRTHGNLWMIALGVRSTSRCFPISWSLRSLSSIGRWPTLVSHGLISRSRGARKPR